MAIPSNPPIDNENIRSGFNGPTGQFSIMDYYAGGKNVPASITGIPSSGQISWYDFLGKSNTSTGEMNFDTPGTYDFVCPTYASMSVEVVGGSGGGGGSVGDGGSVVLSGVNGHDGGNSSFNGVTGGGGGGGGGGQGGRYPANARPGVLGPPGGCSGGDINTFGGGKPGGAGNVFEPSNDARGKGGDGGKSGLSSIVWKPGDPNQPNQRAGAPTAGTSYKVVVGDGGTGGEQYSVGKKGASGYVHIKWS